MRFLLAWSELAFEQMSTLILDLPNRRKEFSAALKRISSLLRDDPFSQGESREENDRLWFVADLIITYTVDEDSRAVEIASIRLRQSR